MAGVYVAVRLGISNQSDRLSAQDYSVNAAIEEGRFAGQQSAGLSTTESRSVLRFPACGGQRALFTFSPIIEKKSGPGWIVTLRVKPF
jgi:hypothetical protein